MSEANEGAGIGVALIVQMLLAHRARRTADPRAYIESFEKEAKVLVELLQKDDPTTESALATIAGFIKGATGIVEILAAAERAKAAQALSIDAPTSVN